MLTFKTIKGKHIVTVNGDARAFDTLCEAWEFIYSIHSKRARSL